MRRLTVFAVLLACAVLAPDGARASSSKKEEAATPQGPQTVMVEGLSVPVVRRRQVEGHVMVVIAVEPVDLAAQHKIEAAMPRLRDAYISDLYAYFGAVGYDGSAAALQAVLQRLTRATERTLGPGVAKSVLLQAASNNPMS